MDLVEWPRDVNHRLYTDSFVCRHRLHELDMFSDAALAELLDRFPRERLEVATMGLARGDWSDWHPVDSREASGADLITAIRRGTLWAKLMRVDLCDLRIAALLQTLYGHILDLTPDLEIMWSQPSILLSSPHAQVYYHADAFPTMLWHIRGHKKVWVYPLNDETLVSPQALEEIIAGRVDQMAPYRAVFDRRARIFELRDGDVLYWPPHAPHRVESVGEFNVTLSVCYETAFSFRRREIYMANRALRKHLGISSPSVRNYGIVAYTKRRSYRLARRLGMLKARNIDPEFIAQYCVDLSSPTGISRLSGGVRLPFIGNRAIRAESAPYYD